MHGACRWSDNCLGVMAWTSVKGIPSESLTPSSSTSTNSPAPVAVSVARPVIGNWSLWDPPAPVPHSIPRWATCYYWSFGGCTNGGNNGEEREWYLPSQVQVRGGGRGRVWPGVGPRTEGTAANGVPKTYTCAPACVRLHDASLNFKYGYVQMVARLPFGPACRGGVSARCFG